MKTVYKLVFLAVLIIFMCLDQNVGFAQSQPDSWYHFIYLDSGVNQTPFGTIVRDFAWGVVNVNAGTITVRSTLLKDDFQFTEPDGSGGLLCGPTDSYTYPDLDLDQYRGGAWNVLGNSVKASSPRFSDGSLIVETLGQESFYIFSPNSFSAYGIAYTVCDGYYDAWESGTWEIPWFWDGTAQVLVSPYANAWHNHKFWDKGWNTYLSIHNNGSQSVRYDIYHVGLSSTGLSTMENPNACSSSTTLNNSRTETIAPSGSWSGNLIDDILNPTSGWTIHEDGFIYIETDPVIPGSSPGSYVTSNSSGSANCGTECMLPTSCHN